ncbi:MAG: SusC/RagA family TonB-linked outer membrane protein [Breznakibacter sp.]|nr:SusC/RagA family TonB-linked outer membrane protein [Breznakibacter sp.]
MRFRNLKGSRSLSGWFMILMMVLTSPVFSQISLSLKNSTVDDVLKGIQKQSDYQFFYNDAIAALKVDLFSTKEASIGTVMTLLKQKTGIDFRIEDSIVYLSIKVKGQDSQIPYQVKGKVLDGTGNPLVGVNVMVKGTTSGMITDMDGQFELMVPGKQSELVFSYIGFISQVVGPGLSNNLTVVLKENITEVSEVVVTALGIKREKKMLGYAMQEIKSEDLNPTGDASVTSALQGKVAGLQMNSSSTGLGGSTKITIRGNSSLSDNNQPLWVVDGVPFGDNNSSSASLYGGFDRGGTAIDINPDDIESISVLKGPNAAALYGSRAGNGVILITTKRGSAKEGFGVSYSGSFTWSTVAETLKMQRRYGQGAMGLYNSDSEYSFGPLLKGDSYTAWNGEVMPFMAHGNKMEDYFNTAFSQNHNVSIGSVKEGMDYRLSFGSSENKGLFDGETMDKKSIDLKSGMEINKYLSVDTKVSLSRTTANNRPLYGKDGEVYQLMFIPNNIRLGDLKKFSSDEKPHVNWVGPHENVLNPYYVNQQYENLDERTRAFGYFSLKLKPTSWLNVTGKYGYDYYQTKIEEGNKTKGRKSPITEDTFSKSEQNFFEQNFEMLLSGDNRLSERIRLSYTAGGNWMNQKQQGLTGFGQNMLYKGQWVLNSAGLEGGYNAAEQAYLEKEIHSIYGSFQVAYEEYLSLDFTARNDWSSTLPSKNNSYDYYSANMSFVASDFCKSRDIALPSWLTFAKLRLSAAQVGKDTDPYQLYNVVRFKHSASGPIPIYPQDKANDQLKPEISSSYEGGVDFKFLRNRLGFDFTYYKSYTKNQIMRVPMSGTYQNELINAGKVVNEGFEMMVYSTPFKRKDFTFDLDFNLAHNRSTVKELHPERKRMSLNSSKEEFLIDVAVTEGGKLGDIYASKAYLRDGHGNVVVRNGLPLSVEGKEAAPIGNIQPDLLVGVNPSLSYRNISLTAMFDMKFGGEIVSVSEAVATGYGMAEKTANRDDVVVKGVNEDGSLNVTPISAEIYYKTIGGEKGFAEEFVYDASYIKLKEVALGYSIPKSMLLKTPIQSLRFSLVGRNLCYLLKHTPGTSPEGGFNTSMFSQAIDFTSVPYSRTFGFSVNVSF